MPSNTSKTVIGVDIGSRHIGFGVLNETPSSGIKYLEGGVIHSSATQPEVSWINYTYRHFRGLTLKFEATTIAIESPKSDSGGMSERLALMNRLIGCICILAGLPVRQGSSPVIRLYTGEEVAIHLASRGHAGKEGICKAVQQRLSVAFNSHENQGYHLSDAAAVALFHLDLVS